MKLGVIERLTFYNSVGVVRVNQADSCLVLHFLANDKGMGPHCSLLVSISIGGLCCTWVCLSTRRVRDIKVLLFSKRPLQIDWLKHWHSCWLQQQWGSLLAAIHGAMLVVRV